MYRLGPSLWVRGIDELMSAHVILNSSNKLGKSDTIIGLSSILSPFHKV